MSSEPMSSRHLSVVVHQTAQDVYAFAADPANLSAWASGLAQGEVTYDGDRLLVDSAMGQVTVSFVAHNDLGVIDHDVTLPSGATVNNPVRVLAHPEGAEVVFTVRQLELTDAELDRDVRTVAADLRRLKELLEQR